jgi:hypothetical protein
MQMRLNCKTAAARARVPQPQVLQRTDQVRLPGSTSIPEPASRPRFQRVLDLAFRSTKTRAVGRAFRGDGFPLTGADKPGATVGSGPTNPQQYAR